VFPIEMNDLVGLPRTDGYEEVVMPTGILVVSSDDAVKLVALGGIMFEDFLELP
jgi:hypothetical protein